MTVRPACFFADGACDGPLDRMHLIPKQVIRKEFPFGAIEFQDIDGSPNPFRRASRYEQHDRSHVLFTEAGIEARYWTCFDFAWSPSTYVYGCRKHHANLDTGRTLRIPRERIPSKTEDWAVRAGLGWYLDREYGEPYRKQEAA